MWYPLWDAGFVLGHSARTVKEALALADSELDALTALLDTRLLAGDDELLDDMMSKVRRLAPKRRNRLIDDLSSGAAARLEAARTDRRDARAQPQGRRRRTA